MGQAGVGQAQPETVRDYELSLATPDGWQVLATIQGNHQRRRVHRFPPVTTRALRLTVTATHGLDHARVLEVRAYPP